MRLISNQANHTLRIKDCTANRIALWLCIRFADTVATDWDGRPESQKSCTWSKKNTKCNNSGLNQAN